MKIRMTVEVSGTRSNGQEWPRRGETIEVGDAEGADLCAAGIAVPLVQDDTETATPEPAEQRGVTTKTGPVRKQQPRK